MSIRNLDLDLLRSFAAVAELGSISAAAQRVGRTQSAVSLQMDRLAEQLGFPVVERRGRGVALTPRGEGFLDDARRLLDLNDRVLGQHVHGNFSQPLRLGFVQDVGELALQRILARLGSAFPGAPITVRVCSTNTMIEKLRAGDLDLAAGYRVETDLPARTVMREQMCWIGARHLRLDPEEPVPLLMFESPCIFRSAGISALSTAGRAFRIALTSPSLPGVMAAVGAGLGITVRSARALRPDLMTVSDLGTPPLPQFEYMLYARAESRPPALDQVEQVIEEELRRERPLFAAA
ncbi:NADH dehydrogenase [Azorhizobium oxalatiphilum]|uniref:NADH dehydrogenase n=1 Tax=Azorhizobium oxalatiphilum TaxID=980631 RepID=A0A917FLS0_9HYPH|nr:LysR substrate-binding domain-containing protein [Azorhizobium oxalatiphilum]GGF88023.1 NADH dehydrogenase [Azorhizobium oxalatiphilum]